MGHIQLELIPRSQHPLLFIDETHELVRLTRALDWSELISVAESIHQKKLKSRAGRRPNLRVLVGAVVLQSVRYRPYRDLEDQIRHYGPARVWPHGFRLGARPHDDSRLCVAPVRGNFSDHQHVPESLALHQAVTGVTPTEYGYDRGGYSARAVEHLQKEGVQDIAIAPKTGCSWMVEGKTKERLVKERAAIERGIGTLKTQKYGFNRPAARSESMMVACGHRAMLGANLTRMLRHLAST